MSNSVTSDRSRVYADHAAATPLSDRVRRDMFQTTETLFANPSSLHKAGRDAGAFLARQHARIAAVLGCVVDEIVFTGSGTESDDLAIIGAARANKARGNHVIVSAIEHKAVLESARVLEREGFEVSYAPVTPGGVVDEGALMELVRDNTILVSVMAVNNEIGTMQPIGEFGRALRARPGTQCPIFHTDACQATGYISLAELVQHVDLLTVNAAKAYGPKGIGLLYKKEGVLLESLIVGGGQENGMRAGTESVMLAAGMAVALEESEEMRGTEALRLAKLRAQCVNGLRATIPGCILNGSETDAAPHIVHVTIPNVEGEAMVLMLDEEGIEAATGSACSSHDLTPSHVLAAIGQSPELMHGSVRFSFGRGTTAEDIERILDVFPRIVTRLSSMSALGTNLYEERKDNM